MNSTSVSESMDLDLVPNLPAGPLDRYRKQASFDWKQMKLYIEQPDRLKIKMRVWSVFAEDPVFRPPAEGASAAELKKITAKQLGAFLASGLFDHIHQLTYQDRTKYLMIVNEATEMYNPCLSIKFALGVSLFANALLSLGTSRHLQFYRDVWDGKIFSCLAITELAHGSDTKRLRTTATYDHDTRQFVIHTPDIQAAKCWVGNLGSQCTHALLFAQLQVGGVCQGLHGFVVPVREPTSLRPYPGITVGDVGPKVGLHGIDNGFIMFHGYRIPKENLLNRTGDVTEEGEYESSIADPQRMLGAALESLSAGRTAILGESCNTLAKAVAIAVRYAAQRLQFADSLGQELPLLEYQTHQWRLFPFLAASYAAKAFTRTFTDEYVGCVAASRDQTMDIHQTTLMVTGVHAIVCCSKALLTWLARDAVQEAREACGGHGYHHASGLGELRNNHDPRVTFEGDNTVLLQQTSNWLLRRFHDLTPQDTTLFPLNKVAYLTRRRAVLARTFPPSAAPTSHLHLASHQFISETYEWLVVWLAASTSAHMDTLKRSTQDPYKVKSLAQVFRARSLALAFAESNVLMYFWEAVEEAPRSLQPPLRNLYYLFGLHSLHKHIGLLYQGGFASSGRLADLMAEAILHLVAELRPDAVALVDALAPPDFVLNSVLGGSDGKIYEKLMAEFTKGTSPSLPIWWNEAKSKL